MKSKQATHEWDEPELQEVQQYIADFKPSQNRVPRSQHRRRQPARNNTFCLMRLQLIIMIRMMRPSIAVMRS